MLNTLNKYLIFISIILINIKNSFAAKPKLPNLGLPGDATNIDNIAEKIGGGLILILIKYVAVIAVISLMLSGIMYLISGGEEEKVKKAKSWIIWSLIGVLFSISAWGIIGLINSLQINN